MLWLMKRILIGFGVMLLFLAPVTWAAPQLKLDPPEKKISAGKTTALTLYLEWPKSEGPYEIHSREPKLENLTLEAHNESQETGATILHTITFTVRTIQKGSARIYPFEISYRTSEDAPWIPILVPEQQIQVTPSFPLRGVLVSLGIVMFPAACAIAGWKWSEARQKQEAALLSPPKDPKQRVYARAEEAIATFSSPSSKEKIDRWTEQLRAVITTYYDIPSPNATNAEILDLLAARDLSAGERNEVSRLLQRQEELRFSRQDIPPHELEQTQKTLLQYVRGKIIIDPAQL